MLNLQAKRFCIFGLQGSGKTVLAKNILAQNPKFYVYDVLHEYQRFNRYKPTNREDINELQLFIRKFILNKSNPKKPTGFVIDEANRYMGRMKPLPDMIRDLNDWQRHYNMAFGVIARRPSQVHTDLIELAHFRIFFKLVGKNDLAYLEELKQGLSETVLNLKEFEYVVLDQFNNETVMPRCPLI